MNIKTLCIATRESPLALWQAHHVANLLIQHWPGLQINFLPMKTSGDRFLNENSHSAAKGLKGLFVKELENALLQGKADLAVHSMKDVPSVLPEGLQILGICKRDNPFDAFISPHTKTLTSLPKSSCIGTSSIRRKAQLQAHYPHLNILPLRGNIHTRLKKLDTGTCDGIILACAGLLRMNISREMEILEPDLMLPAPAQGALGIEGRRDARLSKLIEPLIDADTTRCVEAEREVSRQLDGGCHTPLAAFAELSHDGLLTLKTRILSNDGQKMIESIQQGPKHDSIRLAQAAVCDLIKHGAKELLCP